MRRLFAALVAVLVCDEVTGNGALCLLVFVAVIAAIGSARKADT